MADPRAAVSHEGIGYKAETWPHDNTIVYDTDEENGSAQVGLAVTLEGSETVSLVGDGENVLGKLISVDSDGFCVVQFEGNMTLPGGTGASLTEGAQIVGALLSSAEGYIRKAASGTATELIVCRGIILDSSDSTAVMVKL